MENLSIVSWSGKHDLSLSLSLTHTHAQKQFIILNERLIREKDLTIGCRKLTDGFSIQKFCNIDIYLLLEFLIFTFLWIFIGYTWKFNRNSVNKKKTCKIKQTQSNFQNKLKKINDQDSWQRSASRITAQQTKFESSLKHEKPQWIVISYNDDIEADELTLWLTPTCVWKQ